MKDYDAKHAWLEVDGKKVIDLDLNDGSAIVFKDKRQEDIDKLLKYCNGKQDDNG